MNSVELSAKVLSQLEALHAAFEPPELDEKGKRNAGRMMQEIVCQRLQSSSTEVVRQKGNRYLWGDGVLLNRNARVSGGFWTSIPQSQLEELREIATNNPAVLLFCYFDVAGKRLHAWALPANLAIPEIATIAITKSDSRTIAISLVEQRLTDRNDSLDLQPFHKSIEMSPLEIESLAASVKQDAAAKELAEPEEASGEDADSETPPPDYYTQDSVDFLFELPQHTNDGDWHSANKTRYEQVLRDPTRVLVESLRSNPIARLNPELSATNRNVSILKKNDYGQGGYHDHYWAAFYDPAAGSKVKSCQLFFRMLASLRQFRYGFAFGNNCDEYLSNFMAAITKDKVAVKEYLLTAPAGTVVRPSKPDDAEGVDAKVFAAQLGQADPEISLDIPINIVRQFDLVKLPERAEGLSNEIGNFFEWVWPFFEASRTGEWDAKASTTGDEPELEGIDEDAPQSLEELSHRSALSVEKLSEIEDALLTKQQVILTGPPGTSKTYIAGMFARYFAAARNGRVQGDHSTIFMHANWAYEDFFEGIKPFTVDGILKFEPKLGCFLEWIDSLSRHPPNVRHVLVLDEINRCDTAAVLGELLQLLEYRGRSVPLLSGRKFRFPSNVYIIGTMNSADRSIGRMDLALRRRFLWLDLLPDYGVLRSWLSRTGNNPSGFSSDALKQCNQLLAERGIAPEQQIGHALFMVQTSGNESQASEDKPLIAAALKRIVRYSVLPYVRELCIMQFGRRDSALESQIETALLECLPEQQQESVSDFIDDVPNEEDAQG